MFIEQSEFPLARHAIILAAGRGSRLEPDEGYKLLVEIGGRSLLARHLQNFRQLGVTDVTVVTGFEHEELDETIQNWPAPQGMELHTAINPAFDDGNGLSVLAGVMQARRNEAIDAAEPYWLTMSDHIFAPEIFEAIAVDEDLEEPGFDGVLAVDSKVDEVYDLPDANKIAVDEHGRLAEIGKELDEIDLIDTGLFWCGRGFSEALDAERKERGECSTSDAVGDLSEAGRFRFWDVGDALWQDVDTPGAREHAASIF